MNRGVRFVERQDVCRDHKARADNRGAGAIDAQSWKASDRQNNIRRDENERRSHQGFGSVFTA